MLVFPNAKINIGLNIVEKRADGYHNIETLFYPIYRLYDALEVVEAKELSLTVSGYAIADSIDDNLIIKAYRLLQSDFGLPPVAFYLKKAIPMGAGLGGGSADASFALKALSDMFRLGLTESQLMDYALQIGADCPFFITNRPAYAQGKGEQLTIGELDLTGKYLLMIKPDIHLSTKEAYAGVTPYKSGISLQDVLKQPIIQWRNAVKNDFEQSVFRRYPELKAIKEDVYGLGADYAAMSGSGSTIYGIFDRMPDVDKIGNRYYKKIVLL